MDLNLERITFDTTGGRSKLYYDCVDSVPMPPVDENVRTVPKDPLLAMRGFTWTHPLLNDPIPTEIDRRYCECLAYKMKSSF